MFIDASTLRAANGKSYSRVLLRTSFRSEGKVKHRTLGNLSDCPPAEIQAIRLALKHKDKLASLLDSLNPSSPTPPRPAAGAASTEPAPSREGPAPEPFVQGPSVGALVVLHQLAVELGIVAALGSERAGLLALWQVIARALDQGSRLSAVRLARDLGAACVLGLPDFDEDDLYANLAWLDRQQPHIEQSLFRHRHARAAKPGLYLYDVTSTYLEGEHNALGAFGYNRDGKRGKKQIVIGLLCDEHGTPLAIEAFPGNTSDPKTVGAQIAKLQQRFEAQHITLVGDRGMIRGPQIQDLGAAGMHYISAISKPQIETLLAAGTLQMELFEDALCEVYQHPDEQDDSSKGERYILRRNPVRQAEMAATRQGKKQRLIRDLASLNDYLKEHPRAKESTAQKRIEKRLNSLGLSNWLKVRIKDRQLELEEDTAALAEEAKLDGCYVLRTDLSAEQASKQTVHERYKSLAGVEQAFRRSKSVELEMRPVHVRKETSTRGHLLVVMLAYQLMKELGQRWSQLDMTVEEGLKRLNTYCAVEVAGVVQVLLKPRAEVQELLDAAKVALPSKLHRKRAEVATRQKLPKHRPSRKK